MRSTVINLSIILSLMIPAIAFSDQCASVGYVTNWVNTLQTSISQNCTNNVYKLAASYDGGYIIYLGTGTVGSRLGLVVAPTDVNSGALINWTNTATNIGSTDQYQGIFTSGTSPSNEAGDTNTAAITGNSSCSGSTSNCAAYQATHYTTADATSGWFLPSQAELMLIWTLNPIISSVNTTGYTAMDTSGTTCYWSSTEYNDGTGTSAWSLYNANIGSGGLVGNTLKTGGGNTCKVRAIRAFTY